MTYASGNTNGDKNGYATNDINSDNKKTQIAINDYLGLLCSCLAKANWTLKTSNSHFQVLSSRAVCFNQWL